MQNRKIPNDPELEAIVLGGMLIEQRGVSEVVEVVKDTNVFYTPKNAIVYDAILSLYKSSQGVDIMTVKKELQRVGKLGKGILFSAYTEPCHTSYADVR